MTDSTSLIEKFAALGVELPSWPEEPNDETRTDDWIQRGKAYAKGIQMWRDKLAKVTKSTEAVLEQLMKQMEDAGQLEIWDALVCKIIKLEAQESSKNEGWHTCTNLINSSATTPAQLVGLALDLARHQHIEIATGVVARLIQENERLEKHERSILIAEFVNAADKSESFKETEADWQVWNKEVDFFQKMTTLLALSLTNEKLNTATTQKTI